MTARRATVLAILFFLASTVLMTFPALLRVGSDLIGTPGDDAMQHFWISWWTEHALIDLGASPVETGVLYYPDGAHHPMVAVTPYPQLAALPIALLFGPLVAYNVHWMLTFVLSALSAYLLVLYLTRNRYAAVLAGFVFAFFPNRMAQSTAHFAQIVTYWFPLVALYLVKLKRRPNLRNALVFTVLLALSLLVNIVHIAYFLLPLLSVFLLYWLLADRQRFRGAAPYVLLAMAGAGALTAPFLLPFVWDTLSGRLEYLSQAGSSQFSADAASFVVPAVTHPLLSRIPAFRDFAGRLIADGNFRENTVYLGWVPLVLAGWAIARGPRRRLWPWLALALVAAVLSLGPSLKVAGIDTGLPMPYQAAQLLPFYKWGRVPGRFNETIVLGLAVLAGYGFSRLTACRWRQGWLAALLIALVGLEYLTAWPIPTMADDRPAFLREWAAAEDDFAVLDLPQWPLWVREASNYAMFYQTAHERPIVGGYVWRLPEGREGTMKAFQELLWPDGATDILARRRGREAIPLLNQYDIRYVLVHPHTLPPEDRENDLKTVRDALGEPIYASDRLVVFEVPRAQPPEPMEPLVSFSYNWYLVEPISGKPARWLMNDAVLYVHWLREPGSAFRLSMTVEPFLSGDVRQRRLQLTLNGEPAGEAVVGERQKLEFGPLELRQGQNEIEFHVPEGCQSPADTIGNKDRRCLSMLFQEIELQPAGGVQ